MRPLACLSALLACLVLSGCAVDSSPPVATAEEMRTYLMGKTKAEVRQAMGEPNVVSGDGTEWSYTRAYCHPDAPTRPKWLDVTFKNGKVIRVH